MAQFPPTAGPPRTRSHKRILVTVVVSIVAVATSAAALIAVLRVGPFMPACGGGSATVAPSGASWRVAPRSHSFVGSLNITVDRWGLGGSFTAQPGITSYLLTLSQNASWTGGGAPAGSVWTSGHNVTSGTFNATIFPGSYVLTWWNENASRTAYVNATTEILASDERTC